MAIVVAYAGEWVKDTLNTYPICVLFYFRLNSMGSHGSDKHDQYQASSPDRDSSTDFDDIDMDDKSFDDDDDEKIDIENDDGPISAESPSSAVSAHAPQISPT